MNMRIESFLRIKRLEHSCNVVNPFPSSISLARSLQANWHSYQYNPILRFVPSYCRPALETLSYIRRILIIKPLQLLIKELVLLVDVRDILSAILLLIS